MFFYLSILGAALLAPAIFSALTESRTTSKKFAHLPWVGTTAQQWWKLNYVRIKNFIYLKRDYTSIADQVSVNLLSLLSTRADARSIGPKDEHASYLC